MGKTTTLTLVLVFSVAFCIAGFLPVKPAEAATAQNTASPNSLPLIYIRGNGTVEGTNLIQRNGDVYTFVGDIGNADTWAYGIVVERDNAVINGAGHALRGHGDFVRFVVDDNGQLQPRPDGPPSITGITTSERSNITIKNLTIQVYLIIF